MKTRILVPAGFCRVDGYSCWRSSDKGPWQGASAARRTRLTRSHTWEQLESSEGTWFQTFKGNLDINDESFCMNSEGSSGWCKGNGWWWRRQEPVTAVNGENPESLISVRSPSITDGNARSQSFWLSWQSPSIMPRGILSPFRWPVDDMPLSEDGRTQTAGWLRKELSLESCPSVGHYVNRNSPSANPGRTRRVGHTFAVILVIGSNSAHQERMCFLEAMVLTVQFGLTVGWGEGMAKTNSELMELMLTWTTSVKLGK